MLRLVQTCHFAELTSRDNLNDTSKSFLQEISETGDGQLSMKQKVIIVLNKCKKITNKQTNKNKTKKTDDYLLLLYA